MTDWRDIATDSPAELDRIMVAGWQPPSGTVRGYWWVHEDFTDERGVPIDRPTALKWMPIPPSPEGVPE